MRQKVLYIAILFATLILLPKTNAQDKTGIFDRIKSPDRTPFIQSVTICYKQNGFKYLPEYGFTTTDCRFNTQLVYFDLQGSTVMPTQVATQDIQIPADVKGSTQAQEAFDFYAMLVNSDQREIVTQNDFTTSFITLPNVLNRVFPDLNGKHEIKVNSFTELQPDNMAQINVTATVE